MFSYVTSLFSYLFSKNEQEDDDYDSEMFLAEQLIDLDIANEQNETTTPSPMEEIPRNATCFQRTGLITFVDNDYVLIDGMLYFNTLACSIHLSINDKVLYLGYKDANESITVVRILENQGIAWDGEEEEIEENKFDIIEHVIIGEVGYREDRFVYIKETDLKFSLDDVAATFVPIKGDWLELRCKIQWDDDKPADINAAQVLEVISYKPLRRKIKSAVITDWSGEFGTCDRNIYFDQQSVQIGVEPQVGWKVMVEAIESTQGTCSWRVIKLLRIESDISETVGAEPDHLEKEQEASLILEKEYNIEMTHPVKFKVNFQDRHKLTLNISNNSDQTYQLNKWIILTKKRDSQINVQPSINRPCKLYPKQTFSFTVTCYPKLHGKARECLIVMFKGFQLKRIIEINVETKNMYKNSEVSNGKLKTENQKRDIMRQIRKHNDDSFVPGERLVKPPAFVSVRLGAFPIPEKLWNAVLGDSEQTIIGADYDRILERIETNLPCLSQDLNINNYIDKWHTLLYMEEIQTNISMRAHDMSKAFLIRCQEYLGIEVKGLAEKRPSLIKGDRVMVKDTWNTTVPSYEGFIHAIHGDMVLMKFNQRFHETYTGSDVSIEFHATRSVYRKAHQAINLAISNLGPDILFPSRVTMHPPQLKDEDLSSITWGNQKLNSGQKAAVINILKGECSPMPYIIYGPPGTGKTVTVVETILQILMHLPDSRILVATPSNSSSNLITERLIEYRNLFSDSIIRIIANYLLDSENIPEIIKPFCATLDIASEQTCKPKQYQKDGVNINCQTSYVGRHRVTIGTCSTLGTLGQMGLPRGHFTHIIVDEAGQATEPEIMIPMTFTDKENGHIILAGDPMQLGPVVMSKYCQSFGMDESYLSRLLETFPYQRDYVAYENGFNKKLVTKLNDNYRSLSEVLKLPSEMFYDASLVDKMDRNQPWITGIIEVMGEIFDMQGKNSGGTYCFGVQGQNARAEDSPSWYNPQEASMLALTTCKLYKKNISPDDIGVITPYIAQIKYLRLLFDAMGLPQPKIGTVEEFQGQERRIILISTVRSTESYVQEDLKFTLGFVKNPKRLNVALTRAQVAVILFCNPHLLCTDHLWNKVVSQAVKEGKYMGCELPSAYSEHFKDRNK